MRKNNLRSVRERHEKEIIIMLRVQSTVLYNATQLIDIKMDFYLPALGLIILMLSMG